MTYTERRQQQRDMFTRLCGWWFVLFTSITLSLLVSAAVVGLSVRWYVQWSISTYADEIKQKLNPPTTQSVR